ncbi:Piso0_002704 [Millerozyma farinosa CBS 7064]|uniref:Piso0_002704 protein n=1 Tax=Pichia sorbitophila (strain ATCC MYA-4447 / BCRC 22081 / CBS 7064 / NBRC 10061 / NRRL Y-12695) TaxID=559304 RepID=G8YFR3_PICSO|nr:Piso0_002704 [Millerozyma farinosa CBS 7064]
MNASSSIHHYTDLFREESLSDEKLWLVYTSPVHEEALKSSFDVNLSQADASTQSKVLDVYSRILKYGGRILSSTVRNKNLNANSVDSSASAEDPQKDVKNGGDREDQSSRPSTAVSGESGTFNDDESEDITVLIEDNSSVGDQTDSLLSNLTSTMDKELAYELIINIIRIMSTWFKALDTASRRMRRADEPSPTSNDLVVSLFDLTPGKDEGVSEKYLHGILLDLKTVLGLVVKEVNTGSESYKDANHVVRHVLRLLSHISKSLLYFYNTTKDSDNQNISRNLIFQLLRVNFYSELDQLLSICTPNKESDSYNDPFISLDHQAWKSFYLIYSFFAVFSDEKTVKSFSSSPDGNAIELRNPTFSYCVSQMKNFDHETYISEVSSISIPLLSLNFNLFYGLAPDLMTQDISNSSFFGWITGNRFGDNLYTKFDTVSFVTNFSSNLENLTSLKQENSIIKELQTSFDFHTKFLKQYGSGKEGSFIENTDLLPINLFLFTLTKNSTFLKHFATQAHPVNHTIEDLIPNEDKHVELYEIWLCLLSYSFHYQYRFPKMQSNSQLALAILTKLTSPDEFQYDGKSFSCLDLITDYKINEFKWKICQHKRPLIPLNIGKEGIKSSVFYCLDVLQTFFRFNLTRKLNIHNFKLAILSTFRIIEKLKHSEESSLNMESYGWSSFYHHLMNVVIFIAKQDLINSEYMIKTKNTLKLKSLVEEFFVVIDMLLSNKFRKIIQLPEDKNSSGTHLLKSVNYELIYLILLNYEKVKHLLSQIDAADTFYLKNISACLGFLESSFYLNEEKQDGNAATKKLDTLNLDYDSALLVEKLMEFSNVDTDEDEDILKALKFKESFKLKEKRNLLSDSQLLRIFNVAFDTI